MGTTLRAYVAGLKIERGIPGLVDGGSVIEAQLDAGYESAASFTHAFRSHTGLSPQAYRQGAKTLAPEAATVLARSGVRVLRHEAFDASRCPQLHALTVAVEGRRWSDSVIFVGFYPTALPRGAPILGLALIGAEQCLVEAIPDGTYVPMAVEVSLRGDPLACFRLDASRRALAREGVRFPLADAREIALTLREKRPSDPPITVNLLHLLLQAARRGGVTVEGRKSRQSRQEHLD